MSENINGTKIINKVPRLLIERKITVTQLRDQAGIANGTAYKLVNIIDPPKRIDLDVLARLCDFFECGVGDIFEVERI